MKQLQSYDLPAKSAVTSCNASSKTDCDERIVARGTMDHAWRTAVNAAREAKGRANLFYRLREGIKDSADFRQPSKRGRPFKQRVTG